MLCKDVTKQTCVLTYSQLLILWLPQASDLLPLICQRVESSWSTSVLQTRVLSAAGASFQMFRISRVFVSSLLSV